MQAVVERAPRHLLLTHCQQPWSPNYRFRLEDNFPVPSAVHAEPFNDGAEICLIAVLGAKVIQVTVSALAAKRLENALTTFVGFLDWMEEEGSEG